MFKKLALLLFTVLFLSTPTHADIYQCYQLEGATSFQDQPCPSIDLEELIQLKGINAIDALPTTSAGLEEGESDTDEADENDSISLQRRAINPSNASYS